MTVAIVVFATKAATHGKRSKEAVTFGLPPTWPPNILRDVMANYS